MSSRVTYLPCQPGINLTGLGGNLWLVPAICKANGEAGRSPGSQRGLPVWAPAPPPPLAEQMVWRSDSISKAR